MWAFLNQSRAPRIAITGPRAYLTIRGIAPDWKK